MKNSLASSIWIDKRLNRTRIRPRPVRRSPLPAWQLCGLDKYTCLCRTDGTAHAQEHLPMPPEQWPLTRIRRPLMAESGPSMLPMFGHLNVRFREKRTFRTDVVGRQASNGNGSAHKCTLSRKRAPLLLAPESQIRSFRLEIGAKGINVYAAVPTACRSTNTSGFASRKS